MCKGYVKPKQESDAPPSGNSSDVPNPNKECEAPTKSVSFDRRPNNVRSFEPPSYPSDQRWYTIKDHERFKRERLSDMISFHEGTAVCLVGLEQLFLETRNSKRVVVRSVLLVSTAEYSRDCANL